MNIRTLSGIFTLWPNDKELDESIHHDDDEFDRLLELTPDEQEALEYHPPANKK